MGELTAPRDARRFLEKVTRVDAAAHEIAKTLAPEVGDEDWMIRATALIASALRAQRERCAERVIAFADHLDLRRVDGSYIRGVRDAAEEIRGIR